MEERSSPTERKSLRSSPIHKPGRVMPFEFRKVSNYGASHPVVARLCLQTVELTKWMTLDKDLIGELNELYCMTLQGRLLKCYETFERLKRGWAAAFDDPNN